MDFPTFPPHFPNTDYLFYPSLRPSSAFSISTPTSFLFDSDHRVSSSGTRPGTASPQLSRSPPAADRESENIAASWRRRRSSKKGGAEVEVGDRRQRYEYLILFTPGNPGVIGYYRPFLSKLSELLQQADTDYVRNGESCNREKPPVSVLGVSNAGFSIYDKDEGISEGDRLGEKEEDTTSFRKYSCWTNWGLPPYSLRQQVEMKVEFIEWIYEWYQQRQGHLSTTRNKDGTSWRRKKLKIILMGHSVGGYILLETVRLFNKKKDCQKERVIADRNNQSEEGEAYIVGGILLFPTIQDIALSKKGRVFTPIVTRIPKIHILGKILTYLLLYIIPYAWQRWIVGKVTGFLRKPQEQSHKLDEPKRMIERHGYIGNDSNYDEMLGVTMGFLRSKYGVEEALYLCRDEMLEIKEDKWDEEIWGVPPLPSDVMTISSPENPGSQQLKYRNSKAFDHNDWNTPTYNSVFVPKEAEKTRYPQRTNDNVDNSPSRPSWRNSTGNNIMNKKRLKLVIYFAKDDHWVADETRDSLIRLHGRRFQSQHPSSSASRQRQPSFRRSSRASTAAIDVNLNEIDSHIDSGYADDNDTTTCVTDSTEEGFVPSQEDFILALEKYKPQMIVCKDGLPHGFCLVHGEIMAIKVFGWVEEMVMAEEEECFKRERRKR